MTFFSDFDMRGISPICLVPENLPGQGEIPRAHLNHDGERWALCFAEIPLAIVSPYGGGFLRRYYTFFAMIAKVAKSYK